MTYIPNQEEKNCLIACSNDMVISGLCACVNRTINNEITYDKCRLVAKEQRVYTTEGKFMFSVSMTDRNMALADDDGFERGKESWLDYRERTKSERELEKQKQYKLAADLADAFNKVYGDLV